MENVIDIPGFYLFNIGGGCVVHRKDLTDGTCRVLSTEDGDPIRDKSAPVVVGHFSDDYIPFEEETLFFNSLEEALNHLKKEALLKAMSDFRKSYFKLLYAVDAVDGDVLDKVGFSTEYPFDASFDELNVAEWADNVIDNLKKENCIATSGEQDVS